MRFWCPDAIQKLNRNWNSGKLIRFSSFSTQNGHCNEWIGNHLNIKHPDYIDMAPLQFAFYGQLWTTFAPKMTFSKLKIAFNICTRVKRHVHVQGPWRQLGVNNMSSTVVQQNFSQLIPCVCTNSLTRVYFLLVWSLWTVLLQKLTNALSPIFIISKDHRRIWPRLDLVRLLFKFWLETCTCSPSLNPEGLPSTTRLGDANCSY